MNTSQTDVLTPPWVRVSESRYIHRSGVCFERPRTWKRKGFWIAMVALAEALIAAWIFRGFH